MRIPLLAIAASLIALSADAKEAPAARCLAYGEAKALYRGAYLTWHRGTHGRRCWGIKERKRNGTKPVPFVPSPPVQIVQAPLLDLLEHPGWAYDHNHGVERARRAPWAEVVLLSPVIPPPSGGADALAEYSTWAPGQEPDVWPVLETETAALGFWSGAAVGGLFCLLLLVWQMRDWFRRACAVGVSATNRSAGQQCQ